MHTCRDALHQPSEKTDTFILRMRILIRNKEVCLSKMSLCWRQRNSPFDVFIIYLLVRQVTDAAHSLADVVQLHMWYDGKSIDIECAVWIKYIRNGLRKETFCW